MPAQLAVTMSAQHDLLSIQVQRYSCAQAEWPRIIFVTVGTVEKILNDPSTQSLATQFYDLLGFIQPVPFPLAPEYCCSV